MTKNIIIKKIFLLIITLIFLAFITRSQSWPNPGHPAGQIGGGTFNGSYGDFTFPGNLTVTKSIGAGGAAPVEGVAVNATGGSYGVWANGTTGVYGRYDASNYGYLGASGTGVYGTGTTWAGHFVGDVNVTGNFSAGTGSSPVLFVDDANDRVGIGTTSPSSELHINGSKGIEVAPTNPSLAGSYSSPSLNAAVSVYVSGKYAYVAAYANDSLTVIDVSDPSNLTLVGSYSSSTYLNGAQSVYVSGEYAYVASSIADSLTVIDVSDPSSPSFVGSYSNISYLDGASGVYVSGKYAYVAADDSYSLTVIDVSDPSSPSYVGNYSSIIYLTSPISVYVSGKYAYVATYGDDLTVIDVSDPSNPSFVGSYSSSAYLNGARSVYVSGKYAYVAASLSANLTVIDVSNSSNPTLVGSYSSSTYLNNPYSVYVSGKYAYVAASGNDSLVVIDVSDPSSPSYVGSYSNISYLDGARSVYVSGKYAYVASGYNDSLSVIELSGIDAPVADIGDLAVGTVDVWENAHIANNLYVDNGLDVGLGGVYAEGGYSGQPFGYAELDSDGSITPNEIAFGDGSTVTSLNSSGVIWNNTANSLDIKQTGIYEVTLFATITCSGLTAIDMAILVDSVVKNTVQPYCHSSVDPIFRGINWVGQINSGSKINATIDAVAAYNLNFELGSTLIARRIA